jgi:hypothetical protein
MIIKELMQVEKFIYKILELVKILILKKANSKNIGN